MATNQRDTHDVSPEGVGSAPEAPDVGGSTAPTDPQGAPPEAGDRDAGDDDVPVGAIVAELPERESDIERRLRQVSSAYVELQAQMKSLHERSERLQEERDRRRRGEVVMAMFEPVQNLRRSLDAWVRAEIPGDAIQGLTLVLEQFQAALSRLGLEEINAAPAPFDPNIHDALCTVPTQHAIFDGQVVQIFEAGYRVGGQVIQPARVIIGRYTEPESPSGAGSEPEPGSIPEAK